MVQFSPNSPASPALIRPAYPPAFAMNTSTPLQNPSFALVTDIFSHTSHPSPLVAEPPLAWRKPPTSLQHANLFTLWLKQSGLDKKPFMLDLITPQLGAEVGSIGLGAMGLLFKGLWGLLGGGMIGAAAGAAITSIIRRQGKPNQRIY